MNKKALLGDTIVFQYSLITMAFFAVVFSVLFFFTYLEKENPFAGEREFNIASINPGAELYEELNRYLYSKLKINEKEITFRDAISLYCYNKDENLLENIKEKTLSLSEKPALMGIFCVKGDIMCDVESINNNPELVEIPVILRTGPVKDSINIDLPQIDPKTKVCLAFGSGYKGRLIN